MSDPLNRRWRRPRQVTMWESKTLVQVTVCSRYEERTLMSDPLNRRWRRPWKVTIYFRAIENGHLVAIGTINRIVELEFLDEVQWRSGVDILSKTDCQYDRNYWVRGLPDVFGTLRETLVGQLCEKKKKKKTVKPPFFCSLILAGSQEAGEGGVIRNRQSTVNYLYGEVSISVAI